MSHVEKEKLHQALRIYSEYCCIPGILLYGRMRFENVCLTSKLYEEVNKCDTI